MKKLLGVVVVFLLLVGCATTESIVSSGKIKKNISKSQLQDAFLVSYPGDDPFIPGSGSEYYSDIDTEIIWGENIKKYYVFRYVSEPVSCGILLCKLGNGTLESWHNTLDEARASLPKKEKQEMDNSSSQSSTSSTSSSQSSTSSTSSSQSSTTTKETYNETKYLICYGEMTKAHKARGFHQRNRVASIKVKETVCKAYAKGEINSYEGKGG